MATRSPRPRKKAPTLVTAAPPRKPTKAVEPKYNWDKIREAYIEGIPDDKSNPDGPHTWPTLDTVSTMFNVNPGTLRNTSGSEKWSEQRESYKAQFAVRRQRVRMAKMVNEAVDFDDKALNVAKLGVAMVTARMSEIAREHREKEAHRQHVLEEMQRGVPVDLSQLPKSSAIDAKELETLARAAQTWHDIGQKAMGIDSTRLEISGPAGGPIQSSIHHSHTAKLQEADADRIAKAFKIAQELGLNGAEFINEPDKDNAADDENDIVDAEVVDDNPVNDTD